MAASQIYRSARVVLLNSTNENLVVQGVATLTGGWGDKQAPLQDSVIKEQSAAEWLNTSCELGVGASAFVRLGSSHGYLTVRWNLPWTGRFHVAIEEPAGIGCTFTVDESRPDAVVMMVTVNEGPS
jgi:hypothetical protein